MMAENNQSIEQKVQRQKTQEIGKRVGYIAFIIFLLLVIALIHLVYQNYHNPRLDRTDGIAAKTARNFYNLTMAYFADGATSVTSDGPPGFQPFEGVTITGGPMNCDGTTITFTNPLIFRYKDSRVSFILKADGNCEIVRERGTYGLIDRLRNFNQKAKKD